MVNKNSLLKVLDKNGVRTVNVFHLYGGFYLKFSYFGLFLKVSTRCTNFFSLVLKKSKNRGILIHTCYFQLKNDGSNLVFRSNSLILLKRRLIPFGSEIFGPCNFFLKRKRFLFSFSGLI